MSENDNMGDTTDVGDEFKRPMIFKKPSKKVTVNTEKSGSSAEKDRSESQEEVPLSSPEIPYKVPTWSGLCPEGTDYALEVLKSGMILEKIELANKPYYVFGRLTNCEVMMAHPTISRYHAVLQYKSSENEDQPAGWYLYDLGSTHGTFLNRQRIKERHYVRVRVGHQIKFGLSSRIYIMLGPDFDAEGESSLTVTEIKKRAAEMMLERQKMVTESGEGDKLNAESRKEREKQLRIQDIREREKARLKEEALRKEKERMKDEGIDWGMGEDEPEEEPDLADNPYASTANEELYLQDPKKTLRGFFSREGIELEYDCVEKGVGQFACSVELPIDDAQGRPVIAEVIHRGKKKDAVVACALEACRILDRVGLLRQAKHESRRRKERDWSADDYYDSDEDTFFDRTGVVEKKRKTRMVKLGVTTQSSKPLDYYELVKKIEELESNISKEEASMESMREEMKQNQQYKEHLDDYKTTDAIPNYYQTTEHKEMISKSKLKIKEMQAELVEMRRLAEVAKPTQLPELIKNTAPILPMKKTNSVIYGKRIRLKGDLMKKLPIKKVTKQETQAFVEEVDSDEETELSTEKSSSETRLSNNIEVSGDTKSSSEICSETGPSCSMVICDEEKTDSNTEQEKSSEKNDVSKEKKMYGPMRPPADYVIPESYFDQETDRDLPEITDENDT
ncbi:kanadaptin isoform X2 [Maniola jurtina]|uniref:kanadaptin isoform X2 n=1 Tax=Maniola jurtina TaxID=191418 RepID=UPI001E68BE3A|nr:kanadaptin isoform X2 [Maniola jurtina]